MDESLKRLKQIGADELAERMEAVKGILTGEHYEYELLKDKTTGEHYLLYAYDHLNIGDGSKEPLRYLLPLESDDVLGILFGDQPYTYPDHWTQPYLRNTSEGGYVWFDPSEFALTEHFERIGRQAVDGLNELKRSGRTDPGAIQRLLDELDKL